jgi:hypothetical protein
VETRTELGRYFDIFMNIVRKPRCSITFIAKNMGHIGRGHRRATISKYVDDMYRKKISLKPNLILKTYEYPERRVYLCRKKQRRKIGHTFEMLRRDKKINYVVLISGNCDFFLTSRDPDLDLVRYDLEIIESSIFCSPIFTIPKGWNLPFADAAKNVMNCQFKKGMLERKSNGKLEWADLDMKIFELMRENVRRPFTEIAGKTDVYSSTVKDHFFKHVLPSCNVAHYFFPKGYDFYMKNQLRIYTDYEKSVVDSFRQLPCTTYAYPLEEGLIVTLFHENINIVMTFIEKMEERGIIEKYDLYTPLWHEHI